MNKDKPSPDDTGGGDQISPDGDDYSLPEKGQDRAPNIISHSIGSRGDILMTITDIVATLCNDPPILFNLVKSNTLNRQNLPTTGDIISFKASRARNLIPKIESKLRQSYQEKVCWLLARKRSCNTRIKEDILSGQEKTTGDPAEDGIVKMIRKKILPSAPSSLGSNMSTRSSIIELEMDEFIESLGEDYSNCSFRRGD